MSAGGAGVLDVYASIIFLCSYVCVCFLSFATCTFHLPCAEARSLLISPIDRFDPSKQPKMEEKLNGSVPVVSPEYLLQW